MKVLFLLEGTLDVRNFSGTTWSLYHCLKNSFDVKVLEFRIPFVRRAWDKLLRISKIKSGDSVRRKDLIEWRKKRIDKTLKEEKVDAIFSVGAIGAASIPENVDIPTYYYTDTTFALLKNYYDYFSGWNKQSEQDANNVEVWANKQVRMSGGKAFFSSEWAANSACKDYGLPKENAAVVRIGSNSVIEYPYEKIKQIIESRAASIRQRVNLLFVGVAFDRKGGKDFLDLCKLLKDNRISFHGDIAGCTPVIPDELKDVITVHGFLSKDNPAAKSKLESLYSKAHFFVLPTHAECTAVVFCESSSFALPSLCYDTGGCSSVVLQEESGHLFSLGNEIDMESWLSYIVSLQNDSDRYKELCESAYKTYKEKLNWHVIGRMMADIMKRGASSKAPAVLVTETGNPEHGIMDPRI